MNVLIVGTGAIGTVYGAQLGVAGHKIAVLEHGTRTTDIKRLGLVARDIARNDSVMIHADVVPSAGSKPYDLVLVCVRAEQLRPTTDSLKELIGNPTLLGFGNNPQGRSSFDTTLPGTTYLGFPGIAGSICNGVAEYLRIPQQPTTLEKGSSRAVDAFAAALTRRGFRVSRTRKMDGWLLYHAIFIASVAAALSRFCGNALQLAEDRAALRQMCRGIEEGFRALHRRGVSGLPLNLRLLHLPILRPFAVRYWRRAFRSPLGELGFAAHMRRADEEMQLLASEAIAQLNGGYSTRHARALLTSLGEGAANIRKDSGDAL